MFDTTTVREVVHCIPPGTLSAIVPVARELAITGRDLAPVVWRWLAATLDELDYGVILLCGGLRVVHLNVAARAELDALHPLQLLAGELRARVAHDAVSLHEAIAGAASRGLRRLVNLGRDGERASISVVPLGAADASSRAAVLVLLGKRSAQVAKQSEVALSTVRSRIGSIRAKTGAESIRALIGQVAVLPPVKSVPLMRCDVHEGASRHFVNLSAVQE